MDAKQAALLTLGEQMLPEAGGLYSPLFSLGTPLAGLPPGCRESDRLCVVALLDVAPAATAALLAMCLATPRSVLTPAASLSCSRRSGRWLGSAHGAGAR